MSNPSQLSKEYQEVMVVAEEYERTKVPKMFEPAAAWVTVDLRRIWAVDPTTAESTNR